MDTSLLVGVPSIDKQHRMLMEQLGKLTEAVTHPDPEAFSEALSQIGLQITSHFDSEEAVLKKCGMPPDEVAGHIGKHNEILEQFSQIGLDRIAGKAADRSEIIRMIEGWLVQHIVEYDLKIRSYL